MKVLEGKLRARLGNFDTFLRILRSMGERFVCRASGTFFAAKRDVVEADQSEAFCNLYVLSLTDTVAAARLTLRAEAYAGQGLMNKLASMKHQWRGRLSNPQHEIQGSSWEFPASI